MGIVKNHSLSYFWSKVKNLVSSEKTRAEAAESSIDDSILTKSHKNVTGLYGVTSYPNDVGNYRVTTPISGLPTGSAGYGDLHISGQGYITHIYRDYSSGIWFGWTADSVQAPTNWKRLIVDNGASSATYNNQYCAVYVTWQKIGRVVTMSLNMTPTQDISSSTGSVTLTDVPSSFRSCSAIMFSPSSAAARTKSVEIIGNKIWFFGTFTSGTAYFASISYISAS